MFVLQTKTKEMENFKKWLFSVFAHLIHVTINPVLSNPALTTPFIKYLTKKIRKF